MSLRLCVAAAIVVVALFLVSHAADATAPPHGHKVYKKDDPRLVHNHKLSEDIPHVFDVRAQFLRNYMREKKDTPNTVTLLVVYAAWCGEACDKWYPVIKELAILMREAEIAHTFQIIKHDVTRDDVMMHKLKLEGVPAIGLVEAAHHHHWKFIKYDGAPDVDALVSFIEQNSPAHAAEHHQKLRTVYSKSKSV